ncbi:MAG: purine phosphorylase, partial [Gammaproteobacteria bacterium]
ALAGTRPIHGEDLLELGQPVASAAEKSALHLRTGAVAGDMESAAVAREALAAGVPFLAVRVVVDAASLSLPACLLPALDDAGRTRPGVLLAGLLRSPGALWPLIALGLAYRRALGTLRRSGRAAGGLLAPAEVSPC